jgi:hypothetical protein
MFTDLSANSTVQIPDLSANAEILQDFQAFQDLVCQHYSAAENKEFYCSPACLYFYSLNVFGGLL